MRLRDAATDAAVASAISALAVEPVKKEPDAGYIAQHILRLRELTAARRIADIKSRLQRTNPVEHAEAFNRMFGELAAVEAHRRALRDQLTGSVT
jgi:DNA primase